MKNLNNSKPETTKELIINKAMELFYHKGIESTPLDAIAKDLDISKGLITYHFQNKKNLILKIRSKIMKSIKNIVGEKYYLYYGTYDLQYATALEFRVLLKFFKEDKNVFRFFYHANMLNMGIISDSTLQFYRLHIKRYGLKVEYDSELRYIAAAAKSAVDGLMASYYNGYMNCDFETFVDYRVRIPFFFLKVPEDKILDIINVSRKMLDEVEFTLGPYFNIE